jgi:hypothetical protein
MNFTAVRTEEVYGGKEVRREEVDGPFHAFFGFQLYYGLYGFTGLFEYLDLVYWGWFFHSLRISLGFCIGA